MNRLTRSVRQCAAALGLLTALHGCASEDAAPVVALAPSEESPADALFVENVGQFDGGARFLVRGGVARGAERSPSAWLDEGGLWITAWEARPLDAERPRGVHLRLSFEGARPRPRVVPFRRVTSTHVSYLTGAPSSWRGDVPLWAGVRYVDLYPGVDLVLEARDGRWGPRIEARTPQARDRVRLRVEGAERVAVEGDGVRIETPVGTMRLPFEGLPGVASPAAVAGGDTGRAAQAALGATLAFSTFLGGGANDGARGVALGPNGDSVVVTGYTYSTNFPRTAGVFDRTANGASDVFVTRYGAGGAVLFSTYLGGTGYDVGYGVAIDANQSVYVTGQTDSTFFPVTAGALDVTYNGGGADAFVAKLNPLGTALTYSTFLGGTGYDSAADVALHGTRATVVGHTSSSNFPTIAGSYDLTWNGVTDVFVSRLSAAGDALVYSTYLGGYWTDWGEAIAVNAAGESFVTGVTDGPYPVTLGAFDGSYNSGGGDAFVTRLNAAGGALIYSTYLGGAGFDRGTGIALDSAGNAHVAGETESAAFPTAGAAHDASFNGGTDSFVSRFNAAGTALTYSTYLGAWGRDVVNDLAVHGDEDYVTGVTDNAAFPFTAGAYDTTFNGDRDVFVARIATAGRLSYSTFFGGAGYDAGFDLAIAPNGAVYVAGETGSRGLPTVAAADPSYNGALDGFLVKF